MYSAKVAPIRTCVGTVLPVTSVKVHNISSKAAEFEYDLGRLDKLSASEDIDFSAYHPSSIVFDGTSFPPIDGTASYRLPDSENLPFPRDENGLFFHGLMPAKSGLNSRDLWIELEIKLAKKCLVGGIAFSGFPHLLYYVNGQGENSSNFGLPREIRVKWNNRQEEFLDDENVFIRQEPVSHSGVHYLTFGPIVTDKLFLRLADWPQFIVKVSQSKEDPSAKDDLSGKDDTKKDSNVKKGTPPKEKESKPNPEEGYSAQKGECIEGDEKEKEYPDDTKETIKEDPESSTKSNCNPKPKYQYGLILPFITVFEYQESVNYRSHLPIGLLACTKTPGLSATSQFCVYPDENSQHESIHWNADYLNFIKSPQNKHFRFSATSCIDQRRKYKVENVKIPETFISAPFSSGESINLYLEQAHDSDRCCSGLKLILPGKILDGILPRTKLLLKVYEIDIVEGLSPLMIDKTVEKEKYLTLIYEDTLPVSGFNFNCRFIRASLSRYFLMIVEAPSDESKKKIYHQLAIEQIEFIQSAHISITTKSAHNVMVDSIHFRLVGENLAEDYSRLGDRALTLCVESMTGGQRNNVLFSANTLLELLDIGNTRIYANMRREEVLVDVSKEKSETLEGSFDRHTSLVNNENWKKSETGADVEWNPSLDNSLNATHKAVSKAFAKGHKGEFENYSNSEIRTYNELIGHEGAGAYAKQVRGILNLLFSGTGISFPSVDFTQAPKLLRNDENDFNWRDKIWTKGFNISNDDFWIGEVRSLSIPPWFAGLSASTLEDFKNMLENIASLINNGGLPNFPDLNAFVNFLNSMTPLGLVNGLAIGGSFSVQAVAGLSISSSTAQLLPSMNYNSTSGTSGSISKQANKTGYTYSQFKTSGQDITRAYTEHDKGVMNRMVMRELNQEGTIKERKKGVEIMWQGKVKDIVTGKIPLGIMLPATGNNYYQNADQSIRVKVSGYSSDIELDVWFEVIEDSIREDY